MTNPDDDIIPDASRERSRYPRCAPLNANNDSAWHWLASAELHWMLTSSPSPTDAATVHFALSQDLIYEVHGAMFDLTKHELNVMRYGGMGIFKLVMSVLFFFPWLAIKMVLMKTKAASAT